MRARMSECGWLGACVACSSWLPLSAEYPEALAESGVRRDFPILQCHGDEDMVVRLTWGSLSHKLLSEHMTSVTWKTYEGMQHSACDEELTDVGDFLRQHIAQVPEEPSPTSKL